MIKEKVNVCDVCNTRITTDKCQICGNDVCKGCLSSPYLVVKGIRLFEYPICRECNLKISSGKIDFELTPDLKDELKKQLTEQITKALLLNSLEGK